MPLFNDDKSIVSNVPSIIIALLTVIPVGFAIEFVGRKPESLVLVLEY